MEEIDKKMKLKKFFQKKSGGGLHHTTPVGVYPLPSSLFEELKQRAAKLRTFKRTIKKKDTIHHIYIRARARAKAWAWKIENKKTVPALFFLCLFFSPVNSKLNIIPLPAYILHTFPKFVQKPYKIPIFYQFCKVEFTK